MSSDLSPLEHLTFGLTPGPRSQLGDRGELKWLPLSAIFIDRTYQRRILDSGKNNIRRMIEEFSWKEFGTLTVSRRGGGRYAIIDGQHRATAAMLHGGIKDVPCLIHTMTAVEEAQTFSAMNSKVTRIHTLQTFRAKVAAGDVGAVRIMAICGAAKVTLCSYPKQFLEAGETMGLGAISMGLNKIGQKPLAGGLKLLRAADIGTGIPAAAIQGTVWALKEQEAWIGDAAKHGEALAGRGGIAKLMEKAEQRRGTYGGPVWKNFEAVITAQISTLVRTGGQDMRRLMAGR